MSLRKRLLLLLVVFAVYAVLAAGVGIYGNQWRVERAADEFQRVAGQTTHVDRLELNLTRQMLLLRELISGLAQAGKEYAEVRENWVAGVQQLMSFAPDILAKDTRSKLLALVESLERDCNECLRLLDEGRAGEAARLLTEPIARQTVPELRRHFVDIKATLSDTRNRSARRLAVTSAQILILTVGVGALAAALVVAGTVLIHRWLIRPIEQLQATIRRFGNGDLTVGTGLPMHDELGELAAALRETAQALIAAERKHRTLFSNLRDAVVICDRSGRVLEYHDGDTRILGVDEGRHVGRALLDIWPEWRRAVEDWSQVIRSAAQDGRRICVHDVRLVSPASNRNGTVVDFVVYLVECGGNPCTAIVVRDVTERHRLLTRLHQAETMEAIGAMAGGFAHDINNLLSCVTGTLSSLAGQSHDGDHAERIQAALRACRRAAGLAKRLLHFARGIQGNPQVFSPGEIIETILNSMESSFFANLAVSRELDHDLRVRMDQDQFAQIVLNLLRNARDAMPEAGDLHVRLESAVSQHPERQEGDETYALLTVMDTGAGMPPEVRERIFEPFFTTKSLTAPYGRGMGLAIVYSNAKTAGGFVRVESEVGSGTSIRVYIPTVATASESDHSTELPVQTGNTPSPP